MKKIIISSATLKQALQKLNLVIVSRPQLPVLANIYCKVTEGKLELITSNAEITIFYRMECEAQEAFDFLIPFDFLNKIVGLNKHCPLEIESGKKVKITVGSDIYHIKVSEKLEDFPKLPELPKKKSLEIRNDVLDCMRLALTTTGGNNPLKAMYSYVLLELSAGKVTVASSDGSYMVYSKEFAFDQQEAEHLLISPKVIKALEGTEVVNVFYHAKALGFESQDMTVVTTRAETKFADFRKVFPPEWPSNLKVQRDVLVDALNKCLLTNDDLHATKLTLAPSELKLSSDDHLLNVKVEIPITYTGTVKEATINSDKLMRLLGQIEHDEISLAIHDPNKAIVLSSEGEEGYQGMIMPIASTKN
jgi:DNA polymerase III subunit beta